MDSFTVYKTALIENGYRQVAPSHETHVMDADVVASIPCPCGECRGRMRYYPFYRQSPRSYRPVARCTACGHWEEF